MVVSMASANSPVLQTTTPAVQDPAFLTLKDFQLRNGVGPWVTRVRITRMWHEVEFMRTNEVTSLDLLLLDDSNDYRAYFNWNTNVPPLEPSTSAIPRHKFVFTEFEALASANANTYLTDVVGVLTSHTNLQQLKRNSGNTCFMRELTLENIRNLEANGVNPQPIVVVVAGAYVKQYLGKASLSSTNATKIYFDVDLPEVLHIKERSSHRTPPREITLPSRVGYYPANKSIADNKVTF
ncbi:hypothetical protein C5167_001215 [Papaver somniferum]|uniref:Replication protein A OB domain-containing protein n=1 Tax=Papaver somniferum TaxID=3469 RepID=A0A4Y7KYM9_PAPSO|nr:hypothetical protein C5167_001215 [Papaver somniferum]